MVHGDEGKLRQILLNVLGNAVKFTEQGGVTLRISKSAESRNGSIDEKNGDVTFHVLRFTFEIIDTGIGISPEPQAKIFEPFQPNGCGQLVHS